ncbi:hypothetical protein EON63_18485 [archaeon]|nr:MAG: hypothetical protein EON63_18485 [archaeon]
MQTISTNIIHHTPYTVHHTPYIISYTMHHTILPILCTLYNTPCTSITIAQSIFAPLLAENHRRKTPCRGPSAALWGESIAHHT